MNSLLRPAVVLFALLASGVCLAADLIDRIVAIVGDRVVLQSDVAAAHALGLIPLPGDVGGTGPDDVRQAVNRVLVLEEVERFGGGQPTSAAIDARIEAIRNRVGADLDALLTRTGLDRTMLRRLAGEQIRLEGYLEQRFTGAAQPTDEEVDALVRERGAEWTRAGLIAPGQDAATFARAQLIDTRRQQLIRDWIASLRRRADITMVGER